MVDKKHPKHPRCPGCSKAMYKGLKGDKAPKKTDPWRFCRNKKCELFLRDQTISGEPTVVGAKPVADEKKRGDQIAQDLLDAPPEKVATKKVVKAHGPQLQSLLAGNGRAEHQAIAITRARIRATLEEAGAGDYDHNIVGIALALLSQETGNHAAANALIDEYKLDERFGIQKVAERSK